MIIKQEFVNIECDACGNILDDENWYPDEEIPTILMECGFKTFGDKHYCPDCWYVDDDDSITTKDGRRFNEEGEEIV